MYMFFRVESEGIFWEMKTECNEDAGRDIDHFVVCVVTCWMTHWSV